MTIFCHYLYKVIDKRISQFFVIYFINGYIVGFDE